MTLLRRDPNHVSNYFHSLFDGIGHRGSSFTDLDRLEYYMAHDGKTGRVLVMEFKNANEPRTSRGQSRALRGLCRISPAISVWAFKRRNDGRLEFCDVRSLASGGRAETITPERAQELYRGWWGAVEQPAPGDDCSPVDGSEIRW